MFALVHRDRFPYPLRELRDSNRASSMNSSLWRTKKAALFWKAQECWRKVALLALTGRASDAVQMITSGDRCIAGDGSDIVVAVVLSYLASAYAELGQFDDAWRCIGEAMR